MYYLVLQFINKFNKLYCFRTVCNVGCYNMFSSPNSGADKSSSHFLPPENDYHVSYF